MNNFVANMVYPRYSTMIADLKEAQKELEDYYAEDQAEVEERAARLTPAERTDYLTRKTIAYTDRMMTRWDKLARHLIVRYNDQNHQSSPSYAPAFIDAVHAQTGDRYVRPAE